MTLFRHAHIMYMYNDEAVGRAGGGTLLYPHPNSKPAAADLEPNILSKHDGSSVLGSKLFFMTLT